MARKRFWFWVEEQDPLTMVLDELGPDERNKWIIQILRAGLLPGGYRTIADRLDRIAAQLATGPHPVAPTPEPVSPPPNFQEALNATMAAFGWDDDD